MSMRYTRLVGIVGGVGYRVLVEVLVIHMWLAG